MDRREPAPGLTARRFGSLRHALAEVESTQTVARHLPETEAPEGTVVTADHQRAGRGRGGRTWVDRPGENVLFSLILHPPISPADIPQLALLGAVGVAEGIEEVTGLAPGIKWPNDLLLAGRKVAGLLAEASSDGRSVGRVILGIGINVNQREFPSELRGGATSLALALGAAVDRSRVLDRVLVSLERRYDAFLARGFAAIHPDWCRRAVTLGRTVSAGDVRGTAVGLDHDGALLVRDAAGSIRRVVAGEVWDEAR